VARREQTSEPAFGSDSFLDVTANLVGVLIILIVLVGLRVAKFPPRPAAVEAEFARRLEAGKTRIDELDRERTDLERRLDNSRRGLAAKQAALVAMAHPHREQSVGVISDLARQRDNENRLLESRVAELADARARLVSLGQDFADAKAATVRTAQKLVHRSPLSSPVELQEVHLELLGDRVTFIDTQRLTRWAFDKLRSRQLDFRSTGQSTGEVGPVDAFKLRFSVNRKEMPYGQAMLSEAPVESLRFEMVPTRDPRGEPITAALEPNSALAAVLDRHSPNKYAITIWTYPDSFLAFRQLRDYLSDRGYVVAARPLPFDRLITFATEGTRSESQ
jgi:hypothetical protein